MEEVVGTIEEINIEEYKYYFAFLEEEYNVTYTKRIARITPKSGKSLNYFSLDEINNEISPIIGVLSQKYKVEVEIIGDFAGFSRKLNINKIINYKEKEDVVMSLTIFLLENKKESIFKRLFKWKKTT